MSSLDTNNVCRLISPEDMELVMAGVRLDAIRENQRFGLPMIVQRDGVIVHVDSFAAEAELLKKYPALVTQQSPLVGPP